ncbi:hypothetical protein LTS08_008696 [Lithohypha guttulata]|nr:hypothetical protein LTS08_008696 [Lithohypha guttulata]
MALYSRFPSRIHALANGTQNILNVTVYGNVTGQLYNGTYPSADDPSWNNPNNTFGKIVDLEDDATKYTTLFSSYNVLTYNPYTANPTRFCDETVNEECPLGPAFGRNSTQISDLPGYFTSHDLGSSYSFSTIEANTRIQSGSSRAQFYACVNAYITPDLGSGLKHLLTYLPLGLLIVIGVATISAAMFSPWGTIDIFRWTSNYGRDEDVLRLVTPGFGDCLQYIQFIVFSGSLSLHYPGYYQPVVSRLGWSTLLFNESLVTGGNGTIAIADGIYHYRRNSTRGLDRMTQLIGMTSPTDAWADMMVWLVVIMTAVVVLTQVGFLLRWIYRQVKDVAPEDLRSKNWYFSFGNIVRIALGYFLLPLVALSMFQFIIASSGPTYAVALAALVLAFVIAFAVWMTYQFIRIRPKSFLFDDLQTVLLYGPLYNTYRDDTATFALVPIFVNFLRGIAIGAIQDSGIAQLVLLAICEVTMILSLNIIRPYASTTSMNLYQTCFSSTRLFTILLSIAFVPTLDITTATRGWIGYVILLIHACVIIFGFFLNALQTLVEVVARLAGAGGSSGSDAARGGLVKVFGMRQLSRRRARRNPDPGHRSSMGSNAHMLAASPEKPPMAMTQTRSRSLSASSNFLLDDTRMKRASQGPDGSSQGRQTPDGMSTISRLSRTLASPGGLVGLSNKEPRDPYYRPPRRNTNDFMTAAGRPVLSNEDQKEIAVTEDAIDDRGEGSSHNRQDGDEYDEDGVELTKSKTDYAVREVDFYYGVRGPALSGSGGTRRMKTGPADPTGRVSSARGWFKGMLRGKTKENSKGFEVVRSAKAPPGTFPPPVDEEEAGEELTYRDSVQAPEGNAAARRTLERRRTHEDDAVSFSTAGESWMSPIPRAPAQAPALPYIDSVGGIELPSRVGSEASRRLPPPVDEDVPPVPPVPRKSSRRGSSPASWQGELQSPSRTTARLDSPTRSNRDSNYSTSGQQRLPFTRTSSIQQNRRHSAAISDASSYTDEPPSDEVENRPPRASIERPGSVGFVSQHRASDNIRYSPHEAQIPRLSTVEYGYQPSRPTQETQQAQQAPVLSSNSSWSPAWNGSSAVTPDGSQRWSRFRD